MKYQTLLETVHSPIVMVRRIRRATRGKTSVKHSHTIIETTGPSAGPTRFVMAGTGAQTRSADGSPTDILNNVSTGELCRTGSTVKYVTVRIQAGVTDSEGSNPNVNGWLEWAVVFEEEKVTTIPNTNMGVQSLADVAMQMFRNDCLLTGVIPIGDAGPQSLSQDIQIKLPRRCCNFKIGSQIALHTFWRDSDSTQAGTIDIKLIKTSFYKSYN